MRLGLRGWWRAGLHALDNHGLRGATIRGLRKLSGRPDLIPGYTEGPEQHPFDQLHGTDTAGYISGANLATGSPADLYNTAYYAISPSTLRAALCAIPESLDGFSFFDLGCGKGRALLIASEFPFSHLTGIELSPELCRVATVNTSRDPRIEIVQRDAAVADYPAGPLVVFLFHPFLAPLVAKAIGNLILQRRTTPHRTYLLYANCTYGKLMRRFAELELLWERTFPMTEEDAGAHRFGDTHERFTLWRIRGAA